MGAAAQRSHRNHMWSTGQRPIGTVFIVTSMPSTVTLPSNSGRVEHVELPGDHRL
jgi:hypothetical protein